MNETMLFVLQWYGAVAGAVAALIACAFMRDQGLAIGIRNIILLVINCIGIYRYLLAHEEAVDA